MFKGNLFKKCISFVMVFALMAGFVTPAAAATVALTSESAYQAYYVALGDAMTAGVGLDKPEEEAYYVKVAEALGKEDDYWVYAKNELRVEDLRYLLDSTYNGDGYTASLSSFLKYARKEVQGYVSNAEVLTINVGVRNFSTYIVEQMVHYLQNDGEQLYSFNWDAISDSLDNITDTDILNVAESVQNVVVAELKAAASDTGDLAVDLINYVVEVGVYAVMSYIANFNGMVDAVNKLNPDVDLYIVGIYNPAEGETLTYDFNEDGVIGQYESINLGDIFGALIEIANSYAQVLGNRVGNYTYVDPGEPVMLIDQMANKYLEMEDRIPVALKMEMVYAAEDTVVSMIQETFLTYGITKTYNEALALAEEIAACATDKAREELINGYIYEMVVDEALNIFEDKIQEYLGRFSEGGVLSAEQIDELLGDLDDAETEEECNNIIESFVDEIIQDPELQNQAAANVIYKYIEEKGLSEYVTVENVKNLLNTMAATNEDNRAAVATAWVRELAVAKITDYVQSVVGDGYTIAMADAMLTAMEVPGVNTTAVAKECLWNDAFAAYLSEKIETKFEEKGLSLINYDSFDAFVNAIYAAGDDYKDVVSETVLASGAAKVSEAAYGIYTTEQIIAMFSGMDSKSTETEKKAYLKNELGALASLAFDSFWNAYTAYVAASETTVALVGQYLDSVNTAAVALSEYVYIQNNIVDEIIEVYNKNFVEGKLDLTGFSNFSELRESAISAVSSGYEQYQVAIDTALNTCDILDEKFDKVFELLAKIAEVDSICLNDVIAVAKKAINYGGDYISDMAQNLMQGDLASLDDTSVAYLALCYYFADGMMIMPNAEGHQTIASQIMNAINGENTGSTAGNIANAIINKGLDIYHFAKDLAVTSSGQVNTLINPDYYVALGDDIALGTAIEGSDTYVKLLADALAMEYNDTLNIDSDVIANLAISGMRTEELLALVDPTYSGDAYTVGRYGEGYIESLREQYIAAIQEAELITIEIGVNNLVTYPVKQALLAYNGEETYEMDWEYYFGEKWGSRVNRGKTALMDLLMGIVHDDSTCERTLNTVSTAVESLAYGLLGYIFNLDAAVEAIAKLNTEATIVLVGFYNPLKDTYIHIEEPIEIKGHDVDLSEYTIDVSALSNKVINIANRFLTNYVGFIEDDLVAAGQESRIVTVAINDAEMIISNSDVTKDLSTLTTVKTINVGFYDEPITLDVPVYFVEGTTTGGEALHPNADGHEYIFKQILNALDYEIHADVIPEDNWKYYGDADPELIYHVDDLSSLYELIVELKREAGEDVGKYPITATVLKDGGYYEIDLEDAVFEIVARPVTITVVESTSITVGDAVPEFEAVVTDVLTGEVIEGVDVTVTGVPADSSAAGQYTISATLNDDNYVLKSEVTTATLTIEEVVAPEDRLVYIKIQPSDGEVYYGDDVPLSVKILEFYTGEEVDVDLQVVLDRANLDTSNLGEQYVDVVSYVPVPGYVVDDITQATAAFRVLPRPISVDVTVVDGEITNVEITEGNMAFGESTDVLNLTVDGDKVTSHNGNYDVTVNATFEEGITVGTIGLGEWRMELDAVIYLNYYPTLTGFSDNYDFGKLGGVVIWTGTTAPTSRNQLQIDAANTITIEGMKQNADGEWYVQTHEIYAKNLGDMVYIRPYIMTPAGEVIYLEGAPYYSPAQYCYDILNNSSEREDTRYVCAALLQYGASAQVYFSYNTDKLVTDIPSKWSNIDLSTYDLDFKNEYLDAMDVTSKIVALSKTLTGTRFDANNQEIIPYDGSTLELAGAIRFSVGFNLNEDVIDWNNVAKAEVLFWTEQRCAEIDSMAYELHNYVFSCELTKATGEETVDIGDYRAQSHYILAKELSDTVYFSCRIEMTDGTVYRSGLAYYSPEAFVADHLQSSTGQIVTVCERIAVYSEMARIRFSEN